MFFLLSTLSAMAGFAAIHFDIDYPSLLLKIAGTTLIVGGCINLIVNV